MTEHHATKKSPETVVSIRSMLGYLAAHDLLPPAFRNERGEGGGGVAMPPKKQPVRVQSYRRNWPCLCGSGKKFKHCCAPSAVPR